MNKNHVQNKFSKHVYSYSENAVVQRDVAETLVDSCKKQFSLFPSILDIGTGTGTLLPFLSSSYPEAKLYCNDISKEMLGSISVESFPTLLKIEGDAELCELPNTSLYISNFAFQWFADLEKTLVKLWSKCDVLVFTTLLQNTFIEWDILCKKHGLRSAIHKYPTIKEIIQYVKGLAGVEYSIEEKSYPIKFTTPRAFMQYIQALGASSPAVANVQSMRPLYKIQEEFITYYKVCFVYAWRK